MAAMAALTGASGGRVMGAFGRRALTRSSIRLRSTLFWAVGRSSGARGSWQLLHSSLPGKLSAPQVGQIMTGSLVRSEEGGVHFLLTPHSSLLTTRPPRHRRP